MVDKVNLDELVTSVLKLSPELTSLQPVVVKELMHYEIMHALN